MNLFPTSEILTKYKLFWQYPVITEKTFYEQCGNDSKYIGFPWATVSDKRYNVNIIHKILQPYIQQGIQHRNRRPQHHSRTKKRTQKVR